MGYHGVSVAHQRARRLALTRPGNGGSLVIASATHKCRDRRLTSARLVIKGRFALCLAVFSRLLHASARQARGARPRQAREGFPSTRQARGARPRQAREGFPSTLMGYFPAQGSHARWRCSCTPSGGVLGHRDGARPRSGSRSVCMCSWFASRAAPHTLGLFLHDGPIRAISSIFSVPAALPREFSRRRHVLVEVAAGTRRTAAIPPPSSGIVDRVRLVSCILFP